VAVSSGPSPGAASGGAAFGGAEPGDAESEVAGSWFAELGGEEPGGAEPEGVEPGGAESEGAESGGAEPRGAASSGGPAGALPCRSSQQLREWLVRRTHRRSGAPGAGGAADTGGARTSGAGAIGTGSVGCAGAGDPTEPGAAGAGGAGAGGAGVGDPGAGGAGAAGAGVGGTGTGGARPAGAGAVDPGARGAGGTVRPRPYFVPLLQQVLGVPSSTSLPPPFLCPPPDQSQPPLQPAYSLPAPSPYTEQSDGHTERREPASCPSSLPEVPHPASDRARAASPTASRLLAIAVTYPSFESAVASALVAELLDFVAACRLDYATALVAGSVSASPPSVGGDPDAPDIPTPRSYAEAITGPYSSQWQAAMDAEMASWKSTGTYVDEVPPSRANIVDGMWFQGEAAAGFSACLQGALRCSRLQCKSLAVSLATPTHHSCSGGTPSSMPPSSTIFIPTRISPTPLPPRSGSGNHPLLAPFATGGAPPMSSSTPRLGGGKVASLVPKLKRAPTLGITLTPPTTFSSTLPLNNHSTAGMSSLMKLAPSTSPLGGDPPSGPPSLVWADFEAPPELPTAPAPSPPTSPAIAPSPSEVSDLTPVSSTAAPPSPPSTTLPTAPSHQAHQSHTIGGRTLQPLLLPPFPPPLKNLLSHN
ncbi:unnamed protein product, partial [Closterium sp. NIES-54]